MATVRSRASRQAGRRMPPRARARSAPAASAQPRAWEAVVPRRQLPKASRAASAAPPSPAAMPRAPARAASAAASRTICPGDAPRVRRSGPGAAWYGPRPRRRRRAGRRRPRRGCREGGTGAERTRRRSGSRRGGPPGCRPRSPAPSGGPRGCAPGRRPRRTLRRDRAAGTATGRRGAGCARTRGAPPPPARRPAARRPPEAGPRCRGAPAAPPRRGPRRLEQRVGEVHDAVDRDAHRREARPPDVDLRPRDGVEVGGRLLGEEGRRRRPGQHPDLPRGTRWRSRAAAPAPCPAPWSAACPRWRRAAPWSPRTRPGGTSSLPEGRRWPARRLRDPRRTRAAPASRPGPTLRPAGSSALC